MSQYLKTDSNLVLIYITTLCDQSNDFLRFNPIKSFFKIFKKIISVCFVAEAKVSHARTAAQRGKWRARPAQIDQTHVAVQALSVNVTSGERTAGVMIPLDRF